MALAPGVTLVVGALDTGVVTLATGWVGNLTAGAAAGLTAVAAGCVTAGVAVGVPGVPGGPTLSI